MFTPEEWKVKIQEWKKSGLTKKIWCDLNGIKFHSLKYWSARVKQLDRKIESFNSSIFYELKPIQPIGIKIKWQNITFEIDPDFDDKTLKRFLKALD
jgi:hypothetical protein